MIGGNEYVDRSLEKETAYVCGYQKEQVGEILKKIGMTKEWKSIEENYDGYKFTQDLNLSVYNSWAVNNYAAYKSKIIIFFF